jgi:hypothetical protein
MSTLKLTMMMISKNERNIFTRRIDMVLSTRWQQTVTRDNRRRADLHDVSCSSNNGINEEDASDLTKDKHVFMTDATSYSSIND